MSALEDIISHGNRGHRWIDNNHIVCEDGFELSVVAGGGTYCQPRPYICSCAWQENPMIFGVVGETAHDYPGPYTHVEVMHGEDEPEMMAVEDVRQIVADHGGERS